jgi:flagellar hook protein FlgE
MGMGNIATSGMQAAMTDMDIISNNIANAKTYGFKKSSASFADLVPVLGNASGPQIGMGVKLTNVQQNFAPGNSVQTASASDLSINGDGFFVLKNITTGQNIYSRAGQFDFDQVSGNFLIGNQKLQGFPAVNGKIPAGSIPSDITINTATQPAKATTTVTAQGMNLNSSDTVPATTPFNATDTTSYNFTTHSTVYDSLGNSTGLDLYYVKTAPNAWSVYSAVNGTVLNAASPGSMTFSQDGQLTSSTGLSSLSYTPTTGASAMNLNVSLAGTTQYGNDNSTLPFSSDGYPSGQFGGYQIDNNGIITANYSNGPAVLVGQVAIAEFSSPQNLQNLGGAQWQETSNSGAPKVNVLNSMNNVKQGMLEGSNVDIASELVSLMSSQNTFQANAQVEQVYNQVMQTVTKL